MSLEAPLPDALTSPAEAVDAELWEELLLFIEDGQVVPVVGRDLLTVELDGRPQLLHAWLAARLADALGLPAGATPRRDSLNAVASAFLASGGEPERIYYRLHKLLRGLGRLPSPEPLKKLAAITGFKLFVSTTFDPLLAQAINEVRFDGLDYTHVVAYSPREKGDLPADLDHLDRPAVFHLLGSLSPVQDYVVTEEDALEFVHSLQPPGLPVNLFAALDERPLLIVGCSFPGWLVRFFIRASRRNRLLLARGKTDFVVDASGSEDPALLAFLRNFKTRTEFFQHYDAVAFVDELHARWQARPAQAAPTAGEPAVELPPMTPGAVFVSYASEDRPVAQALRDALDAAGMDVWFDRDRLTPGDVFEAKIRRNIEQCSLFIPILSRSCVTPQRRFFRIEWDQAARVAVTVPQSTRFIVPVVIDDLPPDHEDIPARFRELHWERVAGRPSAEFVATIRQFYRDYQRRAVARP